MLNQRIHDIASIYQILTGISFKKSLSVVKSTSTGKAILMGYPDVLYESILNNLYHILCESSPNNLCKFSNSDIKNAYEIFEKEKKQSLPIDYSMSITSLSYKRKYRTRAKARAMSALKKQCKKQLQINQEILISTGRNIYAIKRKEQER